MTQDRHAMPGRRVHVLADDEDDAAAPAFPGAAAAERDPTAQTLRARAAELGRACDALEKHLERAGRELQRARNAAKYAAGLARMAASAAEQRAAQLAPAPQRRARR